MIKYYTTDGQVYYETGEDEPMNKEQKIQELTERIEKSQTELDEIKKELDKLQNKPYEISYPNDGKQIYFISYHSGQVKEWEFNINYEADKCLYDIGLYFDTLEEAEQFIKEQTLIKKIKCWTKEQQGDWEGMIPDDEDTLKYDIYYSETEMKLKTFDAYSINEFKKLPYFKTEEIAQACIDEFGDEILEVFC